MRATCIACAMAVASAAIYAADLQRSDAIVVTATRSNQPINHLLADVRVIDAQAIAASGAQTLTELLQVQGGVEIVANGGAGQVSGVFLRGANPNQVVVLVDGVRINSITTGTNAFENIPLSQIEKIEVLNGAASSLYGADAIGGVIQIFLKQGSGAPRVTASAGGGSYGTWKTDAGIRGASGATRFSLQGGYTRSDGFSATNPRAGFLFDPDNDGYRNRNAGLSLAHDLAPGQTIALRALGSEGRTQFDSGVGGNDQNRQRLSTVALESRNRIAGLWNSRLTFARSTDDIVTSGSFPSRFRTDQDQVIWQNDIPVVIGTLVAGAEYLRGEVSSDTAYTRSARTVKSLFGGFSGEWDDHIGQISLRRDDFSDVGGKTTGSVSYGYRITPRWRAALSLATAFKAPTFNDLYFPLSFGFQGNPDLRPERSRNRELGVYYNRAGESASVVAFDNRIHDLIVVDPSFTTLTNLNDARIRGVSARYGFARSDLRFDVQGTHQAPEDVATGNLLPRRARNHGSASVMKDIGKWRIGVEAVVSGARYDRASNVSASRMGGYTFFNLVGALRLNNDFTLRARWNNVFDKEYELAQGFNTPGSNIFVSLEYAPR